MEFQIESRCCWPIKSFRYYYSLHIICIVFLYGISCDIIPSDDFKTFSSSRIMTINFNGKLHTFWWFWRFGSFTITTFSGFATTAAVVTSATFTSFAFTTTFSSVVVEFSFYLLFRLFFVISIKLINFCLSITYLIYL